MRLIIVRPDNRVSVNGLFLTVDCSNIDPTINVVQWDETVGWIEFVNDGFTEFKTNQPIDNIDAYAAIVEAHQLAAEQQGLPAQPEGVPQEVSPLQARKALRAAGLIDQVNALVNAATDDIKDAWQYASVVSRHDPFVVTLGQQLFGADADTQLDNLFLLAVGRLPSAASPKAI